MIILIIYHSNGMYVSGNEPQTPLPKADQPNYDPLIQQLLEALSDDLIENADIDFLLTELESLQQHPININSASAAEIHRLVFLNQLQVNNLIAHRNTHGKLLSLLELQSIEGFDLETILKITPYITVDETLGQRQFTLDKIRNDGKNHFLVRYQKALEQQKGFSDINSDDELAANPDSRFLGSPYRLFSRYRFTYYNNLSIGITAEKDAGEEFFAGSQPNGFDFYSAHFHLRNAGPIKALSLGDYQLMFGQGLVLWSGFAFGKSSQAINIKKNGTGLRQYTSVDENNFMRGLGITIALGKFEITTFFSSKNRNANLKLKDTGQHGTKAITSLQNSGLHRTPAELDDKNSVRETYIGCNITFRADRFHVGITGYRVNLIADHQRGLSFAEEFEKTLICNKVLGMDYNYKIRNINFFGEIATSQSGGYASLNGIILSVDPRLSVSILHRNFSPEYQSRQSNAFSESGANENGIYVGLNAKISRQWIINAYADHFSFPQIRHRTYGPSRGFDYLLQIIYRPVRDIEIYGRYRLKNKPLNSPANSPIPSPADLVRQNIRIHFLYPVSASITFNNRIETVTFRHSDKYQTGFLVYQDIGFRNFQSKWRFNIRYAIFNTDGFDSRIYAYENDVLYATSFPFFADKGQRAYILARYKLNRNVDLQARIAQTYYHNKKITGSGLEQINSNTRTEIKAQFMLRF